MRPGIPDVEEWKELDFYTGKARDLVEHDTIAEAESTALQSGLQRGVLCFPLGFDPGSSALRRPFHSLYHLPLPFASKYHPPRSQHGRYRGQAVLESGSIGI